MNAPELAELLHRTYSAALDGLDDWGTLTDLDREAWTAVAEAVGPLMEFAKGCRDDTQGYYFDYECMDWEGHPTIREAAGTALRAVGVGGQL